MIDYFKNAMESQRITSSSQVKNYFLISALIIFQRSSDPQSQIVFDFDEGDDYWNTEMLRFCLQGNFKN